jgi:tRNA A-37 threonylcarbamoyl transferase component Bud32/Leucine-rich repeat (LRR) protein
MGEPSSTEAVFCEALEKEPAERAAFLDRACAGNEPLRREVQSLLDAHQKVGPFLERPLVEAEGVADLAAAEATDSGDALPFLAPSPEPGSLGRLHHYEILEVVGRGGTGVVLRARDTKLLRIVAIKVLAAPLAVSGTARQRFAREARATAAIRDEHVIDIHAVCDDAPVPYLVMEYIEGCNLDALLRKGGQLEVKEVLRIGIQVASALAAAHKHGLIHRDVKPANILLENGVQRVKLTDFGLARAADDASLTQSGFIAGTPLYMAPEQAAGEPIDPRTDLFSLGSVLYELCTGRPAFRAETTVAVIRRVCDETPRSIREVNADIPVPLCRLIERLQAKKPANRPASASEVAEELTGLLAELSDARTQRSGVSGARRAGYSAALRTWLGRRKWIWAVAALLLLCAGLGMGEATGVTNVRGVVIRLLWPEGTLVVEVDDPGVSVTVDGTDVVITGAGVKEVRLKPGQYKVEASKNGKLVRRELVTVARDGRQVVRISAESSEAEPLTEAQRWEKAVAALPATEQVEAVSRRLKELNPGFDGQVSPSVMYGAVTRLVFNTDAVQDISPVRALRWLESLECQPKTGERRGKVADLSPLRGLSLKLLKVADNDSVSDLSPLKGMPLEELSFSRTQVEDLTSLRGMPLRSLYFGQTRIADLSPLKGMKLTHLYCDGVPVSDLSPLQGMPLEALFIPLTRVSDLSPLRGMTLIYVDVSATPVSDLSVLKGMPVKWLRCDFQRERDAELLRSLTTLEKINLKPAAEFWKEVDGK